MPEFQYKSLKSDGAVETGQLESVSEQEAFRRIRDKGLSTFEIRQVSRQGEILGKALLRRGPTNKDRARYLRQMATLLGAGLPLLEVMESMARGGHPDLRRRSVAIRKALRAGERMSETIGRIMPDFPEYVPRLCELGEAAGALSEALADAAGRMERQEALRREIRSALTYPAFLAVAGVAITILMFVFVIPRFEALIGDNRESLPFLSIMVLQTSAFFRDNALLVALAGTGAVAAAISAARGGRLRQAFERFLDRLPLVGPFLRRADLANWARTMGVAMKHGAGLLAAFDLAARAVRSPRFRHGLSVARRAVRAGEPLDEAVGNALDLDATYTDLLRTGRQAASLEDMLLYISDILDDDARERAKRLTNLAEPVAILLIAIVVGTLVLGIVLAMTSLYEFTV